MKRVLRSRDSWSISARRWIINNDCDKSVVADLRALKRGSVPEVIRCVIIYLNNKERPWRMIVELRSF